MNLKKIIVYLKNLVLLIRKNLTKENIIKTVNHLKAKQFYIPDIKYFFSKENYQAQKSKFSSVKTEESQLRFIIKKEILSHIYTYKYIIAFILFVVLLLFSTFLNVEYYKTRQELYKVNDKFAKEHLSGILDREIKPNENWKYMDIFYDLSYSKGYFQAKKPNPYTIFMDGTERSYVDLYNIKMESYTGGSREIYLNPFLKLFLAPNIFYIISIVVSLFSLLFVFDSICGEKEQGTLKLMLTNSVSRATIIIGKWVGGFVAAVLPFIISLLIAFIYIIFSGVITLSLELAITLLLFIIVTLVYISFYFNLGIFISTMTSRSSTALIVAVFVWTTLALVYPNVLPFLGKVAFPAPSEDKIIAERWAIRQEYEKRIKRVELNAQHRVEGKAKKKIKELEKEMHDQTRKLDNYYMRKIKNQETTSRVFGYLSVNSCYTFFSARLFGVDIEKARNFYGSLKKMQSDFKMKADGLRRKYSEKGKRIPANELPRLYQYISGSFSNWAGAFPIEFLLLLFFNILLFMLTFQKFINYDLQ